MAFIDDRFMLKTDTAERLYLKYAKDAPIFDYHCHIDPKEIYEDKRFDTITSIWLGGDHYKWRLLRSNGVPEKYITGDAPDYEKFEKFCELMPKLAGNPMYVWCHLELKMYFGFEEPLSPDTCKKAWTFLNGKLADPSFSARNIIKRSNVKTVGTTDDPADELKWHKLLRQDSSFDFCEVLPSFRPDKALHAENAGFAEYTGKLGKAAGIIINSLADLKKALAKRIDHFAGLGMKASDHGLNYFAFTETGDEEADRIFGKALSGEKITPGEAVKYMSNLLVFMGGEYKKRGTVMQIHYGAQRNVNRPAFNALGPDTGFDCMSTRPASDELTAFLNALLEKESLPKTVIYSLNPGDNEMIDTVIGSFQGEGVCGLIQHGAAWWFNDTGSGIRKYLESLANLTVLGNFIGMLTDSRSFLSYARHDYFRRILCSFVGDLVENGEYPENEKMLGELIYNICYGNAANYFN
ncbi:MAG: glucuronate isomerase [Clostridia bacterium]|nr:glucuronate isomerase [Clostridia bacterium]